MRKMPVVIAGILMTSAGPSGGSWQSPSPPPPFRPAVVAGDFIHVSGMLPTGADGRIVAGGIEAQTKQAIANLGKALEGAGGRLEDAASVTVYLKRASDFPAMNAVYAEAWPERPPARTTVVANLVSPEALIEISLVGLRRGAERALIHPSGWLPSPNPYSYAVRSGDTLFLSGLVPRRGGDNVAVTGSMTVQAQEVLENAREILDAAGMSLADVVSSRVYITDTALFEEMNAAYRKAFPKDPPARATVRAGLTGKDYLVEITFTAVRTAGREAIATPNADGTPGRSNPNLSSAIRAGSRLYLSGMLGANDSTRGDAGAQTRETLARIGRTLSEAGFTWNHVVESTVFLRNVSDFAAMNEAYRSLVPQPYPARATIEAGLVNANGLVEIMMVASK